jgi:hypothetical protein
VVDGQVGIEPVGDEIGVDVVGRRGGLGIDAVDDPVAVHVGVALEVLAHRDLALSRREGWGRIRALASTRREQPVHSSYRHSPWTALGTPAITIPRGEHEGLPLGLQLTADRGDDVRLLRAAMGVETLLGTLRPASPLDVARAP